MTYHRPPDDYDSPDHCETCHGWITYGPVVGGLVWLHVSNSAENDHAVVMRLEGWWDVDTGQIRYGNGREAIDGQLDMFEVGA